MARFLDYILNQRKDPPLAIYGANAPVYEYPAIVEGLRAKLRGAVPVMADNVDVFVSENLMPPPDTDGKWIEQTDIPNALPPHPLMWIDWKSRDPQIKAQWDWAGCQIESSTIEGHPGILMLVQAYWKVRGYPHVWTSPIIAAVRVNDEGLIDRYASFGMSKVPPASDEDERFAGAVTGNLAVTALTTLSFMNCRNVRIWDDPPPEKLNKSHHRKHGKWLETYKTIDIVPMSRIVGPRAAGTSHEEHAALSLHIMRGHFKTYAGDRKLFGKHSGTFFWSQQVRGSAAAGEVIKSYRIKI